MSENIRISSEEQKEVIIREIISSFDDISLKSESKLYLTEKLVEICYECLCRERRKTGRGWICATGLERRINRAVHSLCHFLGDLDIIVLSFETRLLEDDILYSELKQKYSLGDDTKKAAFKLLFKKTPRPSFHCSLTDF